MSVNDIPPSLIPYLFGQKKDFSSLQDTIIKTNVIFISLVLSTVTLRFWVRFRMLRSAGLDDIFMVVAVVFAMVLSGACLLGERHGLGKHIWNLNADLTRLPHDVGRLTKILYGAYLSYSSAVTFTKLSIIATYSRILPPGGIRNVVHATGAFVVVLWVTSIFAIILTCIPVHAAWDYTVKGAKCYDVLKYFYVAAAFNIATDLLLCVLPMPTLWALRMPKAQRVILCILFSMGTFACVATIIRTAQLHTIGGVDVPYQSVVSLNWSVIEVGTAIMCASLSALRPLATRYLPTLFSHLTHMDPSSASRHKGGFSTTQSQSQSQNQHRPGLSTSESMGQIFVQRSFDVSEMEDWPQSPTRPERSKRAGIVAFIETTDLDTRDDTPLPRRFSEDLGPPRGQTPRSLGRKVEGESCI